MHDRQRSERWSFHRPRAWHRPHQGPGLCARIAATSQQVVYRPRLGNVVFATQQGPVGTFLEHPPDWQNHPEDAQADCRAEAFRRVVRSNWPHDWCFGMDCAQMDCSQCRLGGGGEGFLQHQQVPPAPTLPGSESPAVLARSQRSTPSRRSSAVRKNPPRQDDPHRHHTVGPDRRHRPSQDRRPHWPRECKLSPPAAIEPCYA